MNYLKIIALAYLKMKLAHLILEPVKFIFLFIFIPTPVPDLALMNYIIHFTYQIKK